MVSTAALLALQAPIVHPQPLRDVLHVVLATLALLRVGLPARSALQGLSQPVLVLPLAQPVL